MTLDEALRQVVREEVEGAVADALADVDLSPEEIGEPETWASRVWKVASETRMTLDQVGEALGCSERTVRRYIAGETKHPTLPASDGPMGKTVEAGDLCQWIEDAEQVARFRKEAS